MNFLNKMERKCGRFAIRNLTKYIILLYVIGYVLSFLGTVTGIPFSAYLMLSPGHIPVSYTHLSEGQTTS